MYSNLAVVSSSACVLLLFGENNGEATSIGQSSNMMLLYM